MCGCMCVCTHVHMHIVPSSWSNSSQLTDSVFAGTFYRHIVTDNESQLYAESTGKYHASINYEKEDSLKWE